MARRSPTLDLGQVMARALAPDGAGRGEPDVDPVNEAVLDAATSLLGEYGMRRWSIDDVAERAGLARATVYRRFGSRDAVVHAALGRDAGRFFAALADSVRHLERLDDRVVAGFVAGLRLARRSPLPPLLASAWSTGGDGAALSALMAIGRRALADRYELMAGAPLDPAARLRAETVAEALVRLGLSYLLAPVTDVDLEDDEAARAYFGAVLRPLVGAAP